MDDYPIAGQGVGKNLRCVALLIAKEHRIFLHDGYLRTQSTEGLRQFASERTATENKEASRALFQVKDIFVGQIAGLGEPRNRRNRGSRATGDQCILEAQPFVLNHNRLRSVETCLPEI